MTVKLRAGQRKGETEGYDLARRLVDEAGVAAIGFHPRSAQVHHKGTPDYELAARLVESPAGPRDPVRRPARPRGGAQRLRADRRRRGDARPRLARQPVALRAAARRRARPSPRTREIVAELRWVVDRAVEHLGAGARGRYLRKFYPWYLARLGARAPLQERFQQTDSIAEARALIAALEPVSAAA